MFSFFYLFFWQPATNAISYESLKLVTTVTAILATTLRLLRPPAPCDHGYLAPNLINLWRLALKNLHYLPYLQLLATTCDFRDPQETSMRMKQLKRLFSCDFQSKWSQRQCEALLVIVPWLSFGHLFRSIYTFYLGHVKSGSKIDHIYSFNQQREVINGRSMKVASQIWLILFKCTDQYHDQS